MEAIVMAALALLLAGTWLVYRVAVGLRDARR